MPAPPLTNNFDGGVNGNTIATTDTGSGNQWSNVVIGASATLKYSTAQAHSGTLCGELVEPATGVVTDLQWTGLGSITTSVWSRFYIYLTALPSVTAYFCSYRSASVGSAFFQLKSTGEMVFQNSAFSTVITGTKVIPLNQWVRIELRVLASTTVGELEMWMYSSLSPGDGADGVTPTDHVVSASNVVLQSVTDQILFGQTVTPVVSSQTIRLDDIAVSSTGLIGSSVASATGLRFPLIEMYNQSGLKRALALQMLARRPAITFGGATIPQALTADSVIVTGTLVRQTNKPLTATSVGLTGSLLKQVAKPLTATSIVVTASLLAMKVILKALTATTVVVTASLIKQVNKSLVATSVVLSASLAKQVNKFLTVTTVVVTASLTAIRVFLKTLTATTIVVTSSLVRQVNKPFSITIALSSSLAKQANKKLAATTVVVTSTLTAIKVILKTLTATSVVVTSSMVRQAKPVLTAMVVLSATLTKRVAKTMTATSNLVASLVAQFSGPAAAVVSAAVSVIDTVLSAVGLVDSSSVSVSAQDAAGSQVSVTDASGGNVTAQDGSGASVEVHDLAP